MEGSRHFRARREQSLSARCFPQFWDVVLATKHRIPNTIVVVKPSDNCSASLCLNLPLRALSCVEHGVIQRP